MKKVNVLKAWKDKGYRDSLTAEQIKSLPQNPAGELSSREQMHLAGGNGKTTIQTNFRTECSLKPENCRLF